MKATNTWPVDRQAASGLAGIYPHSGVAVLAKKPWNKKRFEGQNDRYITSAGQVNTCIYIFESADNMCAHV